MSKSEGRKITVKFTQPLTPVVPVETQLTYKYFRWQIDTLWSNRLYIYGIEIKTSDDFYLPTGVISSSGYYSSYTHDRAFDGSVSTYWRPDSYPCWIQIELIDPIVITAFQWNTQTSSYRPRVFKLLGSNDGENWDEIHTAESPAVTYWKEFAFTPLTKMLSGNELAFTVTGQEYKYINGPIIDMEYLIDSVQSHPTLDNKHLQIVFNEMSRFPTVEGQLTVAYDAPKGNLLGMGGAVASFTNLFTPLDLEPEPNPHAQEYLNPVIGPVTFEWFPVEYIDAESTEEHTVTVYPATVTVDYDVIDIENP